MEAEFSHLPVMVREVVELLLPVPVGLIVDCTVGGAGHSAAVLDARPDVRLLGIDRDADAVAAARLRLAPFGDRAQVVQGGFEQLAELVDRHSEGEQVMGILMDLGVSSPQLDRPERGFSYRFDAPLDMRMDAKQALTAADVVNEYDVEELAEVIARNGEERFARRIARGIVAARPLHTTRELVDVIRASIPAPARRRGGHPARRTFQAIRMEVNRELPNLADGLDDSVHVVGPEGPGARARVPLARGPHGEGDLRGLGRHRRSGPPAPSDSRTSPQSARSLTDPAAAAAACRRGGRQPAGRERPSARGRAAERAGVITPSGS